MVMVVFRVKSIFRLLFCARALTTRDQARGIEMQEKKFS